jgi:Phosphotransferase enzyme family
VDDARAALAPLGLEPVSRVEAGYTETERWIVALPGGGRAFAKLAVDQLTADWLRAEWRVYGRVKAPFLPRVVSWHDRDGLTVLVLEDLSGAHWPPPWRDGDVAALRATLADVAGTPPPADLPTLESMRGELAGWPLVEEDPEPFLALGLCSLGWLRRALPVLVEAELEAPLDGDQLVHLDIRSDNLCIRDGRAILVDWNWACIGNAAIDFTTSLPGIHMEGGPDPRELAPPGSEPFAALAAGYFCARAGLPPTFGGRRVRALQLAHAKVALPWAAEALGLPPPG